MPGYYLTVLRFTHDFPREQIAEALAMTVDNDCVRVEDEDGTRLALAGFRQGLDLADALHLAACGDIETVLTFDKPLFKPASRLFAKPIVATP